MKISVIGSGNVGRTLATKWAAAGFEVILGARNPEAETVQAILETAGPNLTAASIFESVAAADVVVFAIPGSAMAETVENLDSGLDDKIVLDATNSVGQPVLHSLDLLRQAVPNGALYRAFSTLGWENFQSPIIGGVQADLFYCGEGDDSAAVEDLIRAIGLRPVYLGGLEQADLMDALTRLWFLMVFERGYGRRLALNMISE